MARVLPVQVGNLLGGEACKFLLDVLLVASVVVPLHPEVAGNAEDEDHATSGTVEAIADREVGGVLDEVGPSCDETTDVAKHDLSKC